MLTLVGAKAIISVVADYCSVAAPYNAELVQAIKEIPGRKWNPDSKTWKVPVKQEDKLREIVRRFYPIDGEESQVEYELVDMTIKADNTAKRSDPHNVEIDGCELVNMWNGNLYSINSSFEVIEHTGGFVSGDASHAFTVEYRVKIKCRKNAAIHETGRCGHGFYEIHSRKDWDSEVQKTPSEKRVENWVAEEKNP